MNALIKRLATETVLSYQESLIFVTNINILAGEINTVKTEYREHGYFGLCVYYEVLKASIK